MPDPLVFAAIAAAVAIGALVQGAVGLGLGLVAAPVVALLAPALMPGSLVWLGTVLPLLSLVKDWRSADWDGLRWAFAGRIPGTVLGVVVVSMVSARLLGVLVGVMVLVAVVLTALVIRLPMRPGVLAGAGVVSGLTGTTTSIGGPPLALVYQHVTGPRLRGTLAAYFAGGGVLSLAGLGLAGELDAAQGMAALLLTPFLLVGFLLGGPVRRHVDAGRTRVAVLVICACSALVLLARSLVG